MSREGEEGESTSVERDDCRGVMRKGESGLMASINNLCEVAERF